jgi:hypothetical protein
MTSKEGYYIYLCSRCGLCYVCKHVLVEISGERFWKTSKITKHKFETVINDARLKEVPGESAAAS